MDAKADKQPPSWLTEALDRSEAQIAAGRSVPLEPVLQRLRAAIDEMGGDEAKAATRRPRKA